MNIEKGMTQSERMAVIREHAQKFTKKLNRNQRVRKTETKSLDKSKDLCYSTYIGMLGYCPEIAPPSTNLK